MCEKRLGELGLFFLEEAKLELSAVLSYLMGGYKDGARLFSDIVNKKTRGDIHVIVGEAPVKSKEKIHHHSSK